MAQQFKVIVNTGKADSTQTLQAEQGAGQRGRPLIIKAKAGAKYQLVETGKSNDRAPDNIKAKRVGKHLHLMFETDTVADVIIEDYYSVMAEGYNGVIGKAENGSYYEYLTEDPTDPGLIPQLRDNATAVTQALGGAEVAPAGAAVAIAALPLLGGLGLLGGAAAVAAAASANNGTDTTATNTTTGKLDASTDSGTQGDNKTNDATPTLSGTAPAGSSANVIVNGVSYPVTVAADGTWKFTQPNNLPDGTYYPILQVTQNGVTSNTNLTPFTIDTTAPTVAVTSNAASLGAGQTATITFTLSEPSADLTIDDVAATGGTLSNWQQSATDPKVYTATFTPTAGNTPGTGTISVASAKFNDAAANTNTDGAEANNSVSLTTNATTYGALQQAAPNDSGVVGDNKTNDTTPTLSGKVPAGSTASVTINGQKYPVTVNPDGTWSFTNPTNLPDGTYTPVLDVTTNGQTSSTPITPFTIDTTPPTIVVASNATTLATGQSANLSFTLSEATSDFSADDITVTGGTLSNFQKSATDPKVYTATFTPTASNTAGTATISVASAKFTDAAGNNNADGAEANNRISLSTNTATSGQLATTSDNSAGTPNDGKTNDKTPELAGKVPAGSTATVTINGQTYPVTVNPDGTWSFTQPTDLPDGTYTPQLNVTTNGQTSSTPLSPFTIDTTAPTVAITSAASALAAGQSTTLTFTLSEASTDLNDADFAVTGGQLGPLQQSASDPKVYTATFTAASTVGNTASVSIASDKFTDAAGNHNKDGADTNNTWSTNLTATPAANTNGVKTALSLDPITGDNIITASQGTATSIPVTGKVTGKYAAGDSVTLSVNGKSYAATVAADGSYSANIPMADLKADPDTQIEASITGTGGDTASAAQDYTVEAGNTPTQTALSINPVTADNILSAAENTGTIAITGTVTGKYAAGDTVTLTVNGKTYTGSAAANGSYSIAVPAADLVADADTQIDGSVTGTGGTSAKALQNYGVDTTPTASAKTALSINPISGDNIITAAEGGASSITVNGKVSGTYAAGDSVTLTLNGKPYAATVAADGSYSAAIPMADFKGDLDTQIEGTVTGTGGDTATASQDYQVETSATANTLTALSIDPVTADNILSNAEATGNTAITGKVTGKFAAGDTVTLTVNGKTFTGTAAANGSYSINVPAADLVADADTQVDGSVTGTGGTTAVALQNYALDNPNNQGNKTALSINPITGDNIITAAEGGATSITVTGKVTGTYAAGDLVNLSINGKIYTAAVASDGSYSANISTTDLKADPDTQIEGTVTGTGGDTASAAQDYTVEAGNTPTQTALSINPVTADNILSAAEATGTIAITGTVTGKYAAGDTVTLTINGKTFTGTAAANGSYSINVPAADLTADADTQIDGSVTGTGGTSAKALQNYALDSGTTPASNASAKTALSIDPIAGDNIVTTTEGAATSLTVTGKVTGTYAAGDLVSLTIDGRTYTAPVAADGSYSVAVSMSYLKADPDTQIEGTVTGTGGDTATAAQDYVIETNANAGTQTALTINPVTADNMIGSGETTGNIAITGTVTGKYAAGDTVTLTINGKTFTGTAAANGSYSIAVPAADLMADSDTQIDGSVTGTGGTSAKALQNYGVDSNITPPASPTGDTTAPTITVERTNPATATLDANGKETITFKLSEASTTFDASDIAVTGGTLSNFTPVPTSGTAATGYTQYTAIFTPTAAASGTATIGVASGKFTDNAGNLNQDTYVNPAPSGATVESNNQVSVAFDTRSTNAVDNDKPTVQVSIDKTSLSAGQSATVSFILSETTADFTLADIDIISGGGTISNLQPVAGSNGVQYTATYTAGNTAGTVQIGVDASKFADAAGNTNADTYKGSASGTTAVSNTTAETNNWVSLTNTGNSDTTAPTVAVTRAGSGTVSNTGETIVFTFSEGVATSSFTSADIDVTGGTISSLAPVETSKTATGVYTQYTASYTPTTNSSGTGTISVAAGKFADAAGNNNLDTYSASADTVTGHVIEANNQVVLSYNTSTSPATPDTTAPTIAISADKTTLSAGQTATITFTLSEPSADFDATDIETSGGSLGTLNHVGVNSSGQDIYTATFTPTTNSTTNGVVKVASDKFKDAAGNFNKDTYASGVAGTTQEADNTVTLTVNTTNSNPTTPAGVKTALSIDPVTGDNVVISTDTANVTITGKASGTFAAGDTVTLTLNNNAYTGQVAADGSYSISVTASDLTADSDTKIEGTITGTGGDTATAAQDYTVESNSTPTKTALTIDRVTTDNTVLASEADSNGNIAITGRVSGKFANGDTVSLVVNGVTSTGAVNSLGFYSINVKATDLLADSDTTIDGSVTGTGGTAATAVQNYALTDLAPPTVAISRSGTGAMTAAETITFTLSEASTTFASADVDVSGGQLSNWATTDNITYTATFTPTSGFFGSGAIGVKSGTFTDAAGNANKDTYEAFVTGTILEENNLLDLSINTDTTPPTVIVSRSTSTTVSGAETITFTLSDNAGTSFDASDIFVTPGAGTLSNFIGDGTVFTATFTPTANSAGSVTIGVRAGKFSDPAGNLNKDTFDSADTVSGKVVETNNAVTFNYKTDNTAPTIAITGPSGTISGPSTITFTLSEVSSDFVWDPTNPSASTNDIVVTGGGTLSALTPSSTTPGVFTATYTPPTTAGTGSATISVASNKFSDAAGNFNTDGGDTNNSLSVNFDTVTPTVAVSRATNATLGGTGSTAATETITFTLSEASSDFTSADIVVSAGALSNWTAVSSTVYTATYTPPTGANAATGSATIGVRSGKFSDAAGNQNADDYTLTGGANSNAENNNNVVSVAYDTVAPTQTASFSSMTKDSGLSTGNANWTTADASAGRLVSGFVSAPLAAGETVQIWVKKDSGAAALLGTATVDAGGTTWAYTDTTNYVGATGATGNTAGWTYSAQVVDAAGNAAATATQVVNRDTTTASTPSAPTIDAVGTDATVATTIANNGSTGDNTLAVKGRGTAGHLVTLFDNTSGNIVKGGILVDSNGDWTADLTGTALGNGTHNFYAVQTNAQGTSSVLSNQYTVNVLVNLVSNGDFESGNAIQQATGSAVTGWTVTAGNVDVLQVTGTKVLDTAGASPGTISQTINGLVVGQTYAWSFTNAREGEVPDLVKFELTGAASLSQTLTPASDTPASVSGTFVAQSTTVTMTFADTLNNGAADRGVLIDNVVLSRVDAVPAPNGSLSAGGTLTAAATAQADALTYSGSPLLALSGNDTITATASDIQSTLAAGGFIDGGAGIDTLKLAAGTTLNLQTLTGNQTVQKIQEVEIIQMQGTSTLTLSANNVLSLGGANATTMAPFSFSSTQQVADGSVAATGSTNSTGKVQMVIQGGTGDALKLDALATDGVSSTAGVLGNSGLTGTWAYKGQVQIGTITYKVYDHSTTQAQVLVDVPVVVTTVSPIAITAISADSGTTATDFITNDTTLVYSGTVPVEYNDANHDVFVEILNSTGTVVQSGTATVTGSNWSLDKTATALAAGNYTIRSTIVNQGTTTTTTSFGSQGVDTQALVIDTTAPTITVTRANNSTSTLTTGQTETINFTLSEASTNFDVSDIAVSGGTLSNFGGSGTSYSATFTPTANTSGTGSISVASSKFSDAAGNQNADGAEANNTASVPYVTAVPTQTATFSSMTKDSSRALDNADWTTADGSAGRLVSGTLDAVLITGQVLKVYSNGTYIGDAVVNGKAWEITDTTAYTAGWTYTAKVQDTAGNTGPTTTRIVNTDFTEAAPVITSVVDAANASIANAGTTNNALSSVSGTGAAGDTIYLYDNTSTNLVGSTVVGANGTWTVSGLDVGAGSNTFSAKQVDALGNESVLSNLWTVSTAGTNLIANGDFASATAFNSGFGTKLTGADYLANTSNYAVQDTTTWLSVVNTTSSTNPASYTGGTWSKSFVNSTGRLATMTGNMLVGNMVGSGTTWSNTVNVVAGKTYQFSFDYNVNFNTDSGSTSTKGLRVFIDGVAIDVVNTGIETGRFVATYTATTTRAINLSTFSDNTRSISPNNAGDYVLDNFTFAQTPPASDNSLVAGSAAPGTSGSDTALTFSAGSIDAQAGNDTITATSTALQATLAAGGFIDGGAGADTLKLAAGTTLDLTALTNNQTVQSIQQIEIFELQGNGSLTLNANDVLSLGGANASTMSAYSFTSTTGGSASANSTGKVQMVITGTSSDALKLKTLAQDGITTNGLQGNTGLGGEWLDMGTTTIGSTSYRVYNHSTTQAQVLTTLTASTESANVAFSSMSKDSGLTGTGADTDWRTADGSAGRLVSGTLAEPLPAGGSVKIYANGTLLGNATVNTAGTAWEFTDTVARSANWTYRADVVNSSNTVTGSATQVVTTDFTEAAPVITSVVDAANASIANAGTTTKTLSSVSGTGVAGDTIYLYDNTSTNLVGSTVVGADGTWTVSGLATNTAVGSGINTFSAKQVDVLGNVSVASNLYTVTPTYSNLITNGEFATFNQNFTTTGMTLVSGTTPINGTSDAYQITTVENAGWTTVTNTNASSGPTAYAKGTWSKVFQGTNAVDASNAAGNPDGAFTGYFLFGQVSSANTRTLWNVDVAIESGKTYAFKFDYANRNFRGQEMGVWIDGNFIPFVTNDFESGHFTAIYNATRTGTVNLNITAKHDGDSRWGDFALDNFNFAQSPPLVDNSLVAGQPVGASSGANTIAFTSGSIDGVAGDDVITAGTDVQTKLAAGGTINGGAGLDTLKLAAGTTLNLVTLTSNQTVKSIQQVETFELQGTSTLTLSANTVLSLGVTDGFSGSAGKVQLLVKGTSSDSVALQNLLSDGVGGNTGLAGMWSKEASAVTVNSATYNVYTHSTTGAQVLISAAIPDSNVSLSASPLVLDLNGDGVQTLNLDLGTQFDLLNTGAKQSVGWVDKHDGLLVMDLNHDGLVNSGAELMGTSTRLASGALAEDGWAALAQYDANTDGVIDAKDAVFQDLQVWVDANSNGVSEAAELKTLADVGVLSIDLKHDNAQTTQNGNVLQGFSSFTTTDGQSHQIVDAWFQTSATAAPTVDLVNAKADILNLNLSDVLKTAVNTAGQHVVQVSGEAADTVNLSNLLDTGEAQGSWQTSGAVVQGGVTYNAYTHSADASLQVLIDQHITQVHAA